MEPFRFIHVPINELTGDLLYYHIDTLERPYPTGVHLRRHFVATFRSLIRMLLVPFLLSYKYSIINDFFIKKSGFAVLIWWIILPFFVTLSQYIGRIMMENTVGSYIVIIIGIWHVNYFIMGLNSVQVLSKELDKDEDVSKETFKEIIFQNMKATLGSIFAIILLCISKRFFQMCKKTFRIWMIATTMICIIWGTFFLFDLNQLMNLWYNPCGIACLVLFHALGFDGGHY